MIHCYAFVFTQYLVTFFRNLFDQLLVTIVHVQITLIV